jgi:nicotinamide-nucleotide amidase
MTMNESESLDALGERLGAVLVARGWRVATAESCTGGGIAEVITRVAGSSAWFDQGFVTYSNAAKQTQLGVPAETLETWGAVSSATVEAMVTGALTHGTADAAVAVSGVAGPGGGSPSRPVGTVWLAWARRGYPPNARCIHFRGERAEVREGAIRTAIEGLIAEAEATP